MALSIAITGTRSTGHHELTWYGDLFATYLGPFATEGAHFYIGGAKGVDTLALRWIADHSSASITVVVPGTIGEQPDEARQAVDQCRGRITEVVELRAPELQSRAYHARNRYMVDRSDMVIGFPLEKSESGSGTWQTLNYAAEQGKPRLIAPV
ncbi:DNA-processing protein DprA [Streptomyces sp. NPDC048644]|uniref:DNA-processing protein DprA n=1 Tax=Streptomyces sp. NPDC048644 TaxID=3365582 RepID=UPI00371FCAF5